MENLSLIHDNCGKLLDAKELKKELESFVGISTYNSNKRHDLARTSIILLKTLPAAREAVLEHLCHVFEEAVATDIMHLDADPGVSLAPSDDDVIRDIHAVLSNFVTSEPEAWSPIISTWSLELLGQLSSKFANRRGVTHVSSNLTELLQLWMTCRASRTLIDLTTQCISTLIATNSDMCIDALLDTSVQHSPHFDWVVAHIGSCFPNTIVNRVLACGLKDFSSQYGEVSSPMVPDKRVPKLTSVVGILAHLAGRHGEDVRKALLELFHKSFFTPTTKQQLSTVPFLLQLVTKSDVLLHVVAVDFIATLDAATLNALCKQIPLWQPPNDKTKLASHVVHLILRSEDGGVQAIRLLLSVTSSTSDLSCNILLEVKQTCALILDTLLLELQRLVYSSCSVDVPLLHSLQHEISGLCMLLLDGPTERDEWLLPLLACVGLYGGERTICSMLELLLTDVQGVFRLHAIADLLAALEATQCYSVSTMIERTMGRLLISERRQDAGTIRNMLTLLQWQPTSGTSFHSTLQCVAYGNIHVFARQLLHCTMEASHLTIDVLGLLIPNAHNLSAGIIVQLCRSVVKYFFQILKRCPLNVKIRQTTACKKVIGLLTAQPYVKNYLIRLLVDGSTGVEHGVLFGLMVGQTETVPRPPVTTLLSVENRKRAISASTQLARFAHSWQSKSPLLPKRILLTNYQCFIDVLREACKSDVDPHEGAVMLAVLVVERISPDTMFNGLAWPEEDFTKVTIERDLKIKRSFDENPILWQLLALLADLLPTLRCCSVILRALLAVMSAHWASCQEKSTSDCPSQLQFTRRIIDVMAAGRMLPRPFSQSSQLLPMLTPYEAYIILADIWQHAKDYNVDNGQQQQSVELLSGKNRLHLHYILQKHINSFGDVFAHFTPMDVT